MRKTLLTFVTLLLVTPCLCAQNANIQDINDLGNMKPVRWKNSCSSSAQVVQRRAASDSPCKRIADMSTARAGHQIFESGNSIVIAGGHTTGYKLTKSAGIFQNNQWRDVAINSSHDNGFSAILGDGRVMVGGGYSADNGQGQSKSVDIYTPSTQTFSKGPDLSVARAGCKAAPTNGGGLYVAGNWKAEDESFDYYNGTQFQSVGYSLGRTAPYLYTNNASDLYVIASTDNNGNAIANTVNSEGEAFFPCLRYKPSDGKTYYLAYPALTDYKPMPLPVEIRNTDYYFAGGDCYFMLTRKGNEYLIIAPEPNKGSCWVFGGFNIPVTNPKTNATINWRGGVFFNNAKSEFYLIGSSGSAGNYSVHILTYQLGSEHDYWVLGTISTFDYDLMTGAWTLLGDGRLMCTGGTDGSEASPRKDAFLFTPPTPDTNQNDTPTPGDSWQTSGLISDGSTFTGSYLSDNRLEDWYKIELTEDGTITLIGIPHESLRFGEISLYVNSVNSSDIVARKFGGATNEDGQRDTLIVIDCKPGTYYVKVARRNYWMGGNGEGTYTLSYDFTPDPLPNDSEPNDTWNTAKKTIMDGETVTGHLGYYYYYGAPDRDLEDWYTIDVPSDGKVTLTTRRYGTLVLDDIGLYTLNEKGDDRVFRQGKRDTLIVENCQPGKYYIRIARGSSWVIDNGNGSYQLHYEFTPNPTPGDMEPNNDFDHAIEIKNGETLTGHLGYSYYPYNYDTEDWYKITVTEPGPVFFECIRDTTTTLVMNGMTLYKPDRSYLASSTINYGIFGLAAEATEVGTYYLQVSRGSSWVIDNGFGSYTLTYGAHQKMVGSNVRVTYIGHDSTRRGIPTTFQIKIENLGGDFTEPFFLCIPASDDIRILWAELPDDNGNMERIGIDQLGGDLDGEDGNCATFICPGLLPYESFTFTMCAEGRVDNKNAPRRVVATATALGVVAYGSVKLVDYATDMLIMQPLLKCVQMAAEHGIITDKEMANYGMAYGLTMQQLRDRRITTKDVVTYVPLKSLSYVGGSVTDAFLKLVPGGNKVSVAIKVLDAMKPLVKAARQKFFYTYGRARFLNDLMLEIMDEQVGANHIVTSYDPNEMCGPAGFGDEHYIREMRTMNYMIKFENKAEATAPAYRIRITDELDENIFDLASVKFGSTSHDGAGYNWKLTREGNKLSWDIEGIELPPNVNAPEGEGFVTFSVNVKPGLGNKAKIKNKATIIFDYNDPIETNEYVNTLDIMPPTASMLSATQQGNDIIIKCQGQDGESGIDRYQYYYATDGKNYILYDESSEPEFVFTIPEGKSAGDYQFYAIAIDNVGNVQQALPSPVSTGIIKLKNEEVASGRWAIYNLNGINMAHGTGNMNLTLPPGIYIIRDGNTIRKIVVK